MAASLAGQQQRHQEERPHQAESLSRAPVSGARTGSDCKEVEAATTGALTLPAGIGKAGLPSQPTVQQQPWGPAAAKEITASAAAGASSGGAAGVGCCGGCFSGSPWC